MRVEQRLQEMGLSLPSAPKPLASYVPAVRSGNLIYTSGMVPVKNGVLERRGKVGAEVTEREAYEDARTAALNALAAISSILGDLDAIIQIVKVTGYVSSAEGFVNQPAVVNGASDLLVEVFGDAGKHARAAVGVYQLPLDAPVEVDVVVEVS